MGCGGAPIVPVTIGQNDDEMTFTRTGGQRTPLSWPHGWSARVLNGRAELLDSNGEVYGIEGDVLQSLIGAADRDVINVCSPAGH